MGPWARARMGGEGGDALSLGTKLGASFCHHECILCGARKLSFLTNANLVLTLCFTCALRDLARFGTLNFRKLCETLCVQSSMWGEGQHKKKHMYIRTYIYIYIYIHTYMHACMHRYIQAYIHTYIHTWQLLICRWTKWWLGRGIHRWEG